MSAAFAARAELPERRPPPAVRRPRRDERWLSVRAGRGRRRVTRVTVSVLMISVAVHAGLLALALLGTSASPQRPAAAEPIPVEVVQAPPAPAQPPPKVATVAKAPEAPPSSPPRLRPSAPPPPPTPAPEKNIEQKNAELKSLRDELAKLQAEQAQLKNESQAAAATAARPAPPAAMAGLGPLPDSFQVVALPSDGSGDGEAVGYAALVFSQLAKAKEIGRHMGQPGSAGVRFDIDAAGGLVDVELAASSGIKTLDDEALAIVRKAAPFPAPPPGAQRSFSANVSFVADAVTP